MKNNTVIKITYASSIRTKLLNKSNEILADCAAILDEPLDADQVVHITMEMTDKVAELCSIAEGFKCEAKYESKTWQEPTPEVMIENGYVSVSDVALDPAIDVMMLQEIINRAHFVHANDRNWILQEEIDRFISK